MILKLLASVWVVCFVLAAIIQRKKSNTELGLMLGDITDLFSGAFIIWIIWS